MNTGGFQRISCRHQSLKGSIGNWLSINCHMSEDQVNVIVTQPKHSNPPPCYKKRSVPELIKNLSQGRFNRIDKKRLDPCILVLL